MEEAATIRINGAAEPLTAASVSALLAERAIDPEARGLAVAVNGAVVPKRAWSETTLAAGDEVEIVKPYAGG